MKNNKKELCFFVTCMENVNRRIFILMIQCETIVHICKNKKEKKQTKINKSIKIGE